MVIANSRSPVRHRILSGLAGLSTFDVSPDGSRIAFAHFKVDDDLLEFGLDGQTDPGVACHWSERE